MLGRCKKSFGVIVCKECARGELMSADCQETSGYQARSAEMELAFGDG